MHALENLFKERFNAVKKLISFNPRWIDDAGDFRRIVADRACRLILNAGEVVKMSDKHQRQYIMVGTPFGMIAIQRAQMFGKTIIKYETTKALVENYANFVNDEFNFFPCQAGILLEQGLTYVTGSQMQDDFQVIAQMATEAGRKVGDGILPPRVPKPKAETAPATPGANSEVWAAALKKRKHKEVKNGRKPIEVKERRNQPRGRNQPIAHIDEPPFIPAQSSAEPRVELMPPPRPKAEPYISIEA